MLVKKVNKEKNKYQKKYSRLQVLVKKFIKEKNKSYKKTSSPFSNK
jgi:hypothetical protein